jgi:F420-dependent oxidoreductase-like protein
MKLGLVIQNFTWPGGSPRLSSTLAEIAEAADEAGFDYLGVMDHLLQIDRIGPVEDGMLEAYTALGFLAAHTRRARLMTVVTAVPFRHPSLLAKAVTTLDVLSGGRACLGIGAGGGSEAQALGIPFPAIGERLDVLEETLQICLRMWSGARGDERPYTGDHFTLGRPLNSPQSLTRPHPPILIGGMGERRTLRLVARYADACNFFPTPDIPRKLELLRSYCEAEGRDYDAIAKTSMFSFDVGETGEKAREVVGGLRWLAGMGIDTVFASVPDISGTEPLEVLRREVIPAAREI